jgi:hypothetical protein
MSADWTESRPKLFPRILEWEGFLNGKKVSWSNEIILILHRPTLQESLDRAPRGYLD